MDDACPADVYPAMRRLERDELIVAVEQQSIATRARPREYYKLTRAGK